MTDCRFHPLILGLFLLVAGLPVVAETVDFGDVRNAVAEVSPFGEGYRIHVSFKGTGLFPPVKNQQVNLSLAKGYALRALAKVMALAKDERLSCSGIKVAGDTEGGVFVAACEIAEVQRVAAKSRETAGEGSAEGSDCGGGAGKEAPADLGTENSGVQGESDAQFLSTVDLSDMPLLNYANARRQEAILLWREWRRQIESVPMGAAGEEQLDGIEAEIAESLDVNESEGRLGLDVHLMTQDVQAIIDLMATIQSDLGHRIDARLREMAITAGQVADEPSARRSLAEVQARFSEFSETQNRGGP
jgi:hypothetical protein